MLIVLQKLTESISSNCLGKFATDLYKLADIYILMTARVRLVVVDLQHPIGLSPSWDKFVHKKLYKAC